MYVHVLQKLKTENLMQPREGGVERRSVICLEKKRKEKKEEKRKTEREKEETREGRTRKYLKSYPNKTAGDKMLEKNANVALPKKISRSASSLAPIFLRSPAHTSARTLVHVQHTRARVACISNAHRLSTFPRKDM